MTNYGSSSAAASLPNSHRNYQPNSNYHGRQPLPDSDPRDLNLFEILLIVCGVLVLMGTPIFLLSYYEKMDPEFRLDSFSISNFTFTNGSRVFMMSEVQLTARNPNFQYSIDYDHIETSIYYKHQLLFQTFLQPFSQEKKQKTSLVAKFAGDGNVVDKWVVDGIIGDMAMQGSVKFNFWLISTIDWKKSWFDLDYTLKVLCNDLAVQIPADGSSGRLTGKPKTCDVDDNDLG